MKHNSEKEIDIKKTQEISRQQAHEEDMREFVEGFSSKKGHERNKEISKWVGTGIFMGSSDAIPGYSGGTTLALIGFFKKLVLVTRCIFVPKYGISRLKALLFMLPFGLGWIAGVFGIAKATEAMASHGLGLELIFFFATFVAFAIPIFIRSIKNNKSHKKPLKKSTKIMLVVFGFSVILTMALIVLLKDGGAPFHGVDKAKHEETFDMKDWWYLAIVAYFAGMVTLIPGGSGAIIQLLAGMYDKIHWTIMANVTHNVPGLFLFAIFTFLGMVTMIFIMSWFLAKHESLLEMLSLGMLLASPIAILIVPETELWGNIKEWPHILGICGSALLGASFALTINHYTKRKQA